MPTVGGSDRFTLYGDEIRLEGGRLVNKAGSLAGAHVTMAESVARLINIVGISPEAALRMAVTVPAKIANADPLASPIGRKLDDLLVLNADWQVAGSGHDCAETCQR